MTAEFFIQNPKLADAMMALITFVIGYLYRARRESKLNKNLALYQLMELWHRLSPLYIEDYGDKIASVMSRMQSDGDWGALSNDEARVFESHLERAMRSSLRLHAVTGSIGFQEKFSELVSLLSREDPLFAYRLGAGGSIVEILSLLDGYMDNATNVLDGGEGDVELIRSQMKDALSDYVLLDMLGEIEKDIRILSWKIGLMSYLKSVRAIKLRKRKLQGMTFDVGSLRLDLLRDNIDEMIAKHKDEQRSSR